MLRMILIIFGALFVLFCLIVCYCACVVAGQEDRRMEAGWVRKIQATQRGLLKKGLSVLRAGGSMVYATCSVLRGENEDALDFALNQGYAELVPLDADWGHLNRNGVTACIGPRVPRIYMNS